MGEDLESQRKRYLSSVDKRLKFQKDHLPPALQRIPVDRELIIRMDMNVEEYFRDIVLNKMKIPITAEDLDSVIKIIKYPNGVVLSTTFGDYVIDTDNKVFMQKDSEKVQILDSKEAREILRRYHPHDLAEAYSNAKAEYLNEK